MSTAVVDALGWMGIAGLIPPLAAVVLGVAIVWGFRRAVLWLRGRSPRVQITQFGWAGEAEAEREAIWITSRFREHLKSLRLDGLDAIPDRAPGAPLVEIVEGVGQGAGRGLDIGKAIGRLFRAAVPDSAYEVWATLRPQEDGGRISIQLIERAGGNRTLVSFTSKGPTWDASAREAAMAVAGALYPRVANADKGPWTEWQDSVPAELIGAYQDALRHEVKGRLEQALGGFRDALQMDPLNPHLRIKVAMMEERLGLSLDAWFTYRAIVDEKDPKLWKGPDRRVRLLALYRLAIHLWDRGVAKQWVEPNRLGGPPLDRHDKALKGLREELMTALECDSIFRGNSRQSKSTAVDSSASAEELLDTLVAGRTNAGAARKEVLRPFADPSLCQILPGRCREGWIDEIQEVLEIVSLRTLEELAARMRVRSLLSRRRSLRSARPPLGRWLRRREFSGPTVRVSEQLVRMKIAASVERRLRRDDPDEKLSEVEEKHDRLMEPWPFPPKDEAERRRLARRLWLWWVDRRDDAWQIHFNAACTIASVLLEGSILRGRDDSGYRHEAVTQMERFAHLAGSGRVADKADWVAFEDPDLAALVETPEFRLWASQHLAFEIPGQRPTRAVDLERYTALIVKRGAEALAESWRRRAGAGAVPADELIAWWREEREIWERIGCVCLNHRSWRERLRALDALKSLAATSELTAIELGHEKRDGTGARKKVPPRLFVSFATRIGDEGDGPERGTLLAWSGSRVEQVRRLHEDGLCLRGGDGPVRLLRSEREAAVKAARIWSCLATQLQAALEDGADPEFGAEPSWDELEILVKA